MREWKKLYEIENWRDKKIEIKLSTDLYQVYEKGKIPAHRIVEFFDKPVWLEAEPELPSYEDWCRNNEFVYIKDKDNISRFHCLSYILTRKELLRRYIEHLAEIVMMMKKENL